MPRFAALLHRGVVVAMLTGATLVGAALGGTALGGSARGGSALGGEQSLEATVIARLPAPIANNAVAIVPVDGGATLYSFNGLGLGKTHADVTDAAYACHVSATTGSREVGVSVSGVGSGACRAIARPPVNEGRLASVALFLVDRIFLFGGYTVAADGGEVSTPEVFAFDPETERYRRRADMPTPVDDAVAFTHADRYVYLVSGWHNDDNVALVQVFDTWEDRWFRATDYPGAPVFGHAGGAVGRRFVVADGVAVIGVEGGRRRFGAVDDVWSGEISASDPAVIDWRRLPAHPWGPLYRMAAAGDVTGNRVVFFGGADNPYNYTGIGYDGVPAQPSGVLFAFDFAAHEWVLLGNADRPSMDHRGLLVANGAYYVVGGLDAEREVSDAVSVIWPANR